MKNLLKLVLPVVAIAFVGCVSIEKDCCPTDKPCEMAPKKACKDDSKEVHKVQY